jgi:hypothetical protein
VFRKGRGQQGKSGGSRTVRQAAPITKQKKVFSYYDNRPADSQKPSSTKYIPKVTRQQWVRNLPAIFAIIVVFISALYCLGLNNKPQVVIAPPTDSTAVPPLRSKQAYQQGAEDILHESILNSTKFTINTARFEKQFLQRFPEVADVSISLPLISQQPVITLQEAEPALLVQSSHHLVVLGKDGRVIMSADSLTPAVRQQLTLVTDQSGLSTDLGKGVLSTTDVQFILTVLAQLKAQHLTPQTVTLPAQSQEVDIKLNGQPYFIKFDLGTSPQQGVGAYLALKQLLDQQKVTPSSYVDVRIEGRAYYK